MGKVAPMAPPPPMPYPSGNMVLLRALENVPDFRRIEPPTPLPWLYRDPQRWLVPSLALVALIILGIVAS